jgi:hypothetical protein
MATGERQSTSSYSTASKARNPARALNSTLLRSASQSLQAILSSPLKKRCPQMQARFHAKCKMDCLHVMGYVQCAMCDVYDVRCDVMCVLYACDMCCVVLCAPAGAALHARGRGRLVPCRPVPVRSTRSGWCGWCPQWENGRRYPKRRRWPRKATLVRNWARAQDMAVERRHLIRRPAKLTGPRHELCTWGEPTRPGVGSLIRKRYTQYVEQNRKGHS